MVVEDPEFDYQYSGQLDMNLLVLLMQRDDSGIDNYLMDLSAFVEISTSDNGEK